MKKKALTLLELTIVLLIIGVLTTLAVNEYINSQKLSRMHIFEANVNEIEKALNTYRGNQVLSGLQTSMYPISLSDPQFKTLFKQAPINPYTGKTMLSNNPDESGILYVSDGLTYILCVAQKDVNDINKNNDTHEPLPVTTARICGSVTPTLPQIYYITFITNPTNAGFPIASPNPANAGEQIVLTPNPNNCHIFTSWSSNDVTISNNTFSMPANDIVITANYTTKQYNISVISNNMLYGTVTGSGTYNCGNTATIVAIPNTGYKFVGWYENNSLVFSEPTYAFIVNSDRILEARFDTNIYTITTISNPTGAGSPSASPNPAIVGQTVELTANPSSCYNFSNWTTPAGVTITNNQFVMPAQNVTVTANYIIKQHNISVAPNNTTYGTVTGSGTYDCGSTATVVASPNPGYRFDGWYEGATRVSTNTTYSFTVNENHTLEARFIANTYTITLKSNPTNAGSPTATPNPAYVGQTVTLTANPGICYNFSNWTVSAGTLSGNTLTMPAQNVTATANYTVKRYNISVSPNNSAYGTVTGSGTYDCGSTATVTAVPNTGYQFTGWYENNNLIVTTATYTFIVDGDRTLEARFQPNVVITFTRNSVAYTDDGTQVGVNVPRYKPGKFGQGIFIEEGTTNLLSANQSSVEIDLSGLDGWNAPSITRDTTTAWHGSASVRASSSRNFSIRNYVQQIPVTAGTYYTGSLYHKSSVPQTQSLAIWWYTNNVASDTGANMTTTWGRTSVTGQAPSGSTSAFIELYGGANTTIWWDGAQFEQKPYATSWTLGGTTRAQETLSISPVSSILTPQQGTIDVWVYVPDFWKPGIQYYRRIWSIGTDAAVGLYWFGYNPAVDRMEFSIYKDATIANTIYVNKPAVGWHLFTARWSNNEMSLWIDGVKMGSKTSPSLPTSFASTNLTIGCRSNTPYDNVNTLIDDFRVSNRARTDAEIQTLYQSNQPAPKDADTTLKLTFDGNLDA